MVKPSLAKLMEKENVNRYALVVATAKCAREITDEYVRQREYVEKNGGKDADKSAASVINQKYRDEKAVKNAISGLYSGEFKIVDEAEKACEAECEEGAETAETEAEEAAEETAEDAE